MAGYIEKISSDEGKCREYFDKSPMIITALLPVIGYEKATELINEFFSSDRKNMKAFLEEKLGKALVDELFSPERITALGYRP